MNKASIGFVLFGGPTKKYSCAHVQVVGVCSREYIPKGTRFGPLVGQTYMADSVPKDANRKYFWRVSAYVCMCVCV